MDTLEFEEIVQLLNLSGTTEVSPNINLRGSPGCTFYNAAHRVHNSSYPFDILYLNPRATLEDIDLASKHASKQPTHIVYEPLLGKRPKAREALSKLAELGKDVRTTREYLESLISRELQVYLRHLQAQEPTHYIDPLSPHPLGRTSSETKSTTLVSPRPRGEFPYRKTSDSPR